MAGHVVKVSVVAETKNFSRAFKGLAKETGLTNLANAGKQAVTTLATAPPLAPPLSASQGRRQSVPPPTWSSLRALSKRFSRAAQTK